MLRSVLKEGFRGGREATVEQLTEQFCQKVALIHLNVYNLDIRFQLSPDKKMLVLSNTTSLFNAGHKSLQGQGGPDPPAEEGEGGGEGEGRGQGGGEGHLQEGVDQRARGEARVVRADKFFLIFLFLIFAQVQ